MHSRFRRASLVACSQVTAGYALKQRSQSCYKLFVFHLFVPAWKHASGLANSDVLNVLSAFVAKCDGTCRDVPGTTCEHQGYRPCASTRTTFVHV